MGDARRSESSGPDVGSLRESPREWLVAYGLYVETALVAVFVVLAVVSLVVLFFAALLSLPTGPPPENGAAGSSQGTALGDLGTVLFNGGLLVTVGLGVLLVGHAVAELLVAAESGRDLDLGDPADLAYGGIRTLQTAGALVFTATVVAGYVLATAGVITDDIGRTPGLVVLGAGGTMVGSVVLHALGRGVRVVVDAL
ncbi:hypothetical protein [Haloarchaeobius iranensis]|uniref:Uncharacterized protein n=1 Tax=Haloarchaeobius iranensis TaxID=996166 RepID=A0A1G9Y036_9EURY|nr:hypothetical protein [Haloarchaeobius iranensis]SDN02482.1 hypothetical protein SAMN05192554_11283 [Haloarchaeobius iranensis]